MFEGFEGFCFHAVGQKHLPGRLSKSSTKVRWYLLYFLVSVDVTPGPHEQNVEISIHSDVNELHSLG